MDTVNKTVSRKKASPAKGPEVAAPKKATKKPLMSAEATKEQKGRMLTGEVISDKMDKTVVVRVERSYTHPLLHKVMRTTKKYKVHDEAESANLGDIVEIREGRPLSKTKYMYLARIIKAQE